MLERQRPHGTKHVVYFGQTPGQGTGSPITIFRHLRRFSDAGMLVSIVSDWSDEGSGFQREGWRLLRLPLRRRWWPPYKATNACLKFMRMRLWANECVKMFGGQEPDAIITYLSIHSELMSEIAACYSRLSGIPMTAIVHDDVLAFCRYTAKQRENMRRSFRGVLQKAQQNWFVSKSLAEAYGFVGGAENVLMPIPEKTGEHVRWRTAFLRRPIIMYAGHIHEQQYALMGVLGKAIHDCGACLEIVARETPRLRALCTEAAIRLLPLLPTNREALEFVASRAAGFLAAYSGKIADMPWIKTSFPSKVVEFGNLGLPILFVSPPDSEIYKWASQRQLPYNLRPDEISRVKDYVRALQNPKQWEMLAEPLRKLSAEEFNPELIHRRMLERIS